nr:Putative plasmid replication protein RepB [Moritella viscosa]
MELKEMQVAFDAGGLISVTVFRAPLVGGYMLSVKTKKGSDHPMTSQRDAKGHPRGFKTIDAAVANAQKVGFTKITVEFG